MTGKTHKRIGAGTALVAAAALLPVTPYSPLLVPFAWLTSRAPDRAEHWLPWLMPWRWRIRFHAHVLPWRWVTVTAAPLDHRRVTHYPETVIPAAIAVAALVFLTLGAPLGVLATGAAIGVVMHLAADAMTITGLPRLRRPDRRRWIVPRRYRVRTGGPVEPWVRLGFTLLALAAAAGSRSTAPPAPGLPAVDPWLIVAALAFVLLSPRRRPVPAPRPTGRYPRGNGGERPRDVSPTRGRGSRASRSAPPATRAP